MNPVFNRYVSGFFIALFLSGCAIYTPKKMYESEIKSKKDVATILGLNYSETWNYHIRVAVQKVDGNAVFSSWLPELIPFVIEVDPGAHWLGIFATYGNGMHYVFHPKQPTIQVDVEAGQVYQIDAQNMGASAVYVLRHIGSHEEYEDYLLKHPEYKQGAFLSKMEYNK
ncbi:hypothetical protein SAMN05216428_105163 [Nitrosospira sp. Nsp11]|uniref:hypothetical protein n=1 Tax=Nitrosospira sp. Nsp11 TaxID=1855338 RepID=UPI00091AD970|nr:hypothetical protein [Nitrosospira sp. Nsp11]SHL73351.1 hypothetical protein SAMN05216428_105163 [Nitrosospira sp. Nsp11]